MTVVTQVKIVNGSYFLSSENLLQSLPNQSRRRLHEPTLPQSRSFRGGLGKLMISILDGEESHALQGRVLQAVSANISIIPRMMPLVSHLRLIDRWKVRQVFRRDYDGLDKINKTKEWLHLYLKRGSSAKQYVAVHCHQQGERLHAFIADFEPTSSIIREILCQIEQNIRIDFCYLEYSSFSTQKLLLDNYCSGFSVLQNLLPLFTFSATNDRSDYKLNYFAGVVDHSQNLSEQIALLPPFEMAPQGWDERVK